MMDVSSFRGDRVELKWNVKGLEAVKYVLSIVRDHRVCVQAGGCLGVFPKFLSTRFDVVYTFEPSAQFVAMTANAPENNIIRMQAALSDGHEMVNPVTSLDGYEGKKVLHVGMTQVKAGGIVPSLRLDDLALPACGLLYLDVEGHELRALRGGEKTITTHRPVVVCEVNKSIGGVDDVSQYLLALGYRLKTRIQSDEVYVPWKA